MNLARIGLVMVTLGLAGCGGSSSPSNPSWRPPAGPDSYQRSGAATDRSPTDRRWRVAECRIDGWHLGHDNR